MSDDPQSDPVDQASFFRHRDEIRSWSFSRCAVPAEQGLCRADRLSVTRKDGLIDKREFLPVKRSAEFGFDAVRFGLHLIKQNIVPVDSHFSGALGSVKGDVRPAHQLSRRQGGGCGRCQADADSDRN